MVLAVVTTTMKAIPRGNAKKVITQAKELEAEAIK